MKTIVFESWMKGRAVSGAKARFILSHFDTAKLKRRRRVRGRAGRKRSGAGR